MPALLAGPRAALLMRSSPLIRCEPLTAPPGMSGRTSANLTLSASCVLANLDWKPG